MRNSEGTSFQASRVVDCIYFSKRDLARDAGFGLQRAKEWLVSSCGHWASQLSRDDNDDALARLRREDGREQLYKAHPSSYFGLIRDIQGPVRENSVNNGLKTRFTPK